MQVITIEGVEHRIECNAFTPFIYAENFTTFRADGREVHEDINAAIDDVTDFIREHDMPPMGKLLQLFWAFEKTAEKPTDEVKVPRFREWLRDLPTSTLRLDDKEGWAFEVLEFVTDNFFPTSAKADVEATPAEDEAATASTGA